MNRDPLYLRHILDAIERIERYTEVGHERFLHETHWQDAIIRQIEIVGEAAKHISPELRQRHPSIDWRAPAAMRNILIHNYSNVDLAIVWNVAHVAMPQLKEHIEQLLEREPELRLPPLAE